jgi:hypothetical protein
VTLYAQWTALPTYTVVYVGNDSTGGNVPVDGTRYLASATVTVRNRGTLVKTGCAFADWNTQANGNGTPYAPGDAFTMGSGNVTLYAHWVVTITATAGANGSISDSGTAIVTAGTNKTYHMTPDANYHVDSVFVNGSLVDSVLTYTFTNVLRNDTISATFAITTYTITATTTGSGTISPSGAVIVNSGTDQVFTIIADPSSTISDVVVDGVHLGPMPSYTFTTVSADHTIEAQFSP